MALVIEFTCDLPNGVHARPASLVETLCNRFSSAIEWRNCAARPAEMPRARWRLSAAIP
jgi:phosphotransferase system HPr-like phosphotransfer protein